MATTTIIVNADNSYKVAAIDNLFSAFIIERIEKKVPKTGELDSNNSDYIIYKLSCSDNNLFDLAFAAGYRTAKTEK